MSPNRQQWVVPESISWEVTIWATAVGQGFKVTTPESSVQWEDDNGRVATFQLVVDAEQCDSDVDSSRIECASEENHGNLSTRKWRHGWQKTWLDNSIANPNITRVENWTWLNINKEHMNKHETCDGHARVVWDTKQQRCETGLSWN